MNVERLRVKKGMLPPVESVKVKVAEPTPMITERPQLEPAEDYKPAKKASPTPIQDQLSTPPGWRFPCPVRFEKNFDPETKKWTGALLFFETVLRAEAYGSFTLETRLTQQFRKWWKENKGQLLRSRPLE